MILNKKLLPLIFAIIMIMPVGIVSAQTTDENNNDNVDLGDLIPTLPKGAVGVTDELQQAHSDITSMMIDHSNNNYSLANEFVFTMTFVDEENNTLVVMLDPILLSLGLEYDSSDVKSLLNNDIDVSVSYGVFIPESHVNPSSQSLINSWISLYNVRCSSPTDNGLCQALAFNLGTQNHYVLDSNNMWQPPSTVVIPPVTPPTPQDTTPPVITTPDNIVRQERSPVLGSFVEFTVTAIDDVDNIVDVTCNRETGWYTVGVYTVTCTATDTAGNTATASFTITITSNSVSEPEPIEPTPILMNVNSVVLFSDDFEDGTLNKWIESDELDWRADRLDGNIVPSGYDNQNKVAEADNCDTVCTLTFANSIDLSASTNSTLSFLRFIDRSLDNTEYLKAEVYNGTTWVLLDLWSPENNDNDRMWHQESYDISMYNNTDFSLRFVASMSSSSEEVGIDDVEISAISQNMPMMFYGGDLMQLKQFDNGTSTPHNGNGTITIGATKTNGDVGFVTAGHNLQVESGIDFVGIYVGSDLIRANSTTPQIELGHQTDVSFQPITEYDNFTVSANQIKKLDGTIINVYTNSTNILVPNLSIKMLGIFTNSQGSVTVTNATTIRQSDITLTNTSISNYDSITGDSGAPIITTINGVNHLVGVHMGYICEFTNYADGRSFDVDLTPGFARCNPDDTPYKIFSSWENTKTALQLQ